MSVLAYLASLSAYEWTCILTAWLLLAIGVGIGIGKGAKSRDAAAPEGTPERCECDTDWLAPWPSGSHLIDVDAVHGLLSEEQVFPTADEAEAAVYNKLYAEIDANFRVLGDAA